MPPPPIVVRKCLNCVRLFKEEGLLCPECRLEINATLGGDLDPTSVSSYGFNVENQQECKKVYFDGAEHYYHSECAEILNEKPRSCFACSALTYSGYYCWKCKKICPWCFSRQFTQYGLKCKSCKEIYPQRDAGRLTPPLLTGETFYNNNWIDLGETKKTLTCMACGKENVCYKGFVLCDECDEAERNKDKICACGELISNENVMCEDCEKDYPSNQTGLPLQSEGWIPLNTEIETDARKQFDEVTVEIMNNIQREEKERFLNSLDGVKTIYGEFGKGTWLQCSTVKKPKKEGWYRRGTKSTCFQWFRSNTSLEKVKEKNGKNEQPEITILHEGDSCPMIFDTEEKIDAIFGKDCGGKIWEKSKSIERPEGKGWIKNGLIWFRTRPACNSRSRSRSRSPLKKEENKVGKLI